VDTIPSLNTGADILVRMDTTADELANVGSGKIYRAQESAEITSLTEQFRNFNETRMNTNDAQSGRSHSGAVGNGDGERKESTHQGKDGDAEKKKLTKEWSNGQLMSRRRNIMTVISLHFQF
jgi:hypothetical protein